MEYVDSPNKLGCAVPDTGVVEVATEISAWDGHGAVTKTGTMLEVRFE
jgi:hypothetical protein